MAPVPFNGFLCRHLSQVGWFGDLPCIPATVTNRSVTGNMFNTKIRNLFNNKVQLHTLIVIMPEKVKSHWYMDRGQIPSARHF